MAENQEVCICGGYYTDRKGGYQKHSKGKQHIDYCDYSYQQFKKYEEEEERLDNEAYDNYINGLDYDRDR